MDYLNKAEKAIQYLADSEEEWANLKAQHQALDKRRKIVRASGIMDSAESSAAMKANDSEASPDYKLAVMDWEQVMTDFYLIDAKRHRAELTIEMYRSVNSSMKRGNI